MAPSRTNRKTDYRNIILEIEFLQSISKVIVTSSAINKMFEIFGSIFEQNGNVGKFGTYFRTKFNLSPIFEKMQIFRTSFQGDLTNLKKYGQVTAYLKFNIRPHWP